jgi:Tfp pilus assembly PilM family ATPase
MAACLDAGEAILREVSLPFKNEDQIRKTIRFELESQIHNYSIEQLVVAHYATGRTDKATHLLGAAVPKTAVARRLQVLEDGGAEPMWLDLDVAAAFNAMKDAGAIDTDAPHLLVFGTTKFTKLVFIEDRKPKSIRTIRFSLTGPAAEDIPVPAGAAADDGAPEPIVIVMAEDAPRFHALDFDEEAWRMEILAKEISRFLLANAAGATPAHILLAGAFQDDQASQLLEAATHIPVRTVNLLDSYDHPFARPDAEVSARLAVPLGLALKALETDALGLDFRQDEFSYKKKFDAIKGAALVTLELAVVLLAAVALHLHYQKTDLRAANAFVLDHHRVVCEDVTGQKVDDAATAYAKTRDYLARLEGPQGQGAPMDRSAREIWRDLFRALQAFQQKYGPQELGGASLYVDLEGLDIRQTTTPGNEGVEVLVRGKVRNLEFAGALKDEVRKAGDLFKDADYVGQLAVAGDLYQFTLRAARSTRNVVRTESVPLDLARSGR